MVCCLEEVGNESMYSVVLITVQCSVYHYLTFIPKVEHTNSAMAAVLLLWK